MRWEEPIPLRKLPLLIVGGTVLFFVLTWAGYGNGAPKFWGDPIPLKDALAQLPRIFTMCVVVAIVGTLLTGMRSNDGPPSS
jgi:hypothetical protein